MGVHKGTGRKLTDAQIAEARRLYRGGASCRELGRIFDLGVSAMHKWLRDTSEPGAITDDEAAESRARKRPRRQAAPPKLTDEVIAQIRDRWRSGDPVAKIASEFGVCTATVYLTARGHRSAGRPRLTPLKRANVAADGQVRVKLDEECVREIKRRVREGGRGTAAQLCREMGLSRGAIDHVVHGRNWAHVV